MQAVCAVLRTPIGSIDHLIVNLPDPDASKVQWTLECYSGRLHFAYLLCCLFYCFYYCATYVNSTLHLGSDNLLLYVIKLLQYLNLAALSIILYIV